MAQGVAASMKDREGWSREFTTHDMHTLAVFSSPFLVLVILPTEGDANRFCVSERKHRSRVRRGVGWKLEDGDVGSPPRTREASLGYWSLRRVWPLMSQAMPKARSEVVSKKKIVPTPPNRTMTLNTLTRSRIAVKEARITIPHAV